MNEENKKKLSIIFVGIPDMALVCLTNLLAKNFNIVGVVPPKKTHETYEFFKNFVKSNNLNFIEYENSPNDPDCINQIKELNADIGVICSYNYRLSNAFIKTTKMGYINCHPSLLPDYRGAAPYFHIVNNGEKVSGVTLHFIDENFDTGDIVYQETFDITPFETMGTIFNRTTYMLSDGLIKVLSEIEKNGDIKRIPQDKSKKYKLAPKVDGNFRIHWNTISVLELERLVRASNPFYNVFTTFRGANFKVLNAEAIPYKHDLPYGRIYKADESKLIVAARDGLLSIKYFQLGTWGYLSPKEFYYMFSPKEDESFI